MITAICDYINNDFPADSVTYGGTWVIVDGKLVLPSSIIILKNQYFRIKGSVLNDGIHQNTEDLQLDDEEFTGYVIPLAIPKHFLKLVSEIEDYQKSDMAKASPYISESLGNYSYSKSVSSKGSPDNSWQTVFAPRLNQYRRLKV